jgi:hypothetical protein
MVDGAKSTDFLPFFLQNSIATAAQKLDTYVVSRIDTKQHLKKVSISIE